MGIKMLPKLSDTKEIIGYGHWLIMRGQHAGNFIFNGHTPTVEERDIARDLQELSVLIKKRLATCKPEEVTLLLDCYDITYRIGVKESPAPEFIDRYRKRVLNSWQEGNGDIEESSVYSLLSPIKIRNCSPQDKKQYETAWQTIREKWIKTLAGSSYFYDATSYENYQRLALLMRENLTDCFNGDSVRAEKAKHGLYDYNKVEDLSTLGSQILRSYRLFVSSLFPDVLAYDEMMALDNNILLELSNRPDIDPYDRKAFLLALEYNKKLA